MPFIPNTLNLKQFQTILKLCGFILYDKNVKNQIKKLVKVAKFFPGCDFCDGRPYDGTSSRL